MIRDAPMLHLDLFSGMGGFSLGLERTGGFRTVCFVEKEPHCHKVLGRHWPGVPIVEDVNDVEGIKYTIWGDAADAESEYAGQSREQPNHKQSRANGQENGFRLWDKFGRRNEVIHAIDIITAGVPCQPASVAGSRAGTDDERWLWPQTIAILRAFRPRWFLAENPTGLLSLDDGGPLSEILDEVEGVGYEVQAVTLRACSVGGPHQRARVFFVCRYVGDGDGPGLQGHGRGDELRETEGKGEAVGRGDDVGNPTRNGGAARVYESCPGQEGNAEEHHHGSVGVDAWSGGAWARGQDQTMRYVEPTICPVAHGFPGGLVGRVAALKMVGNSVVPQLVEMLGNAILEGGGVPFSMRTYNAQ